MELQPIPRKDYKGVSEFSENKKEVKRNMGNSQGDMIEDMERTNIATLAGNKLVGILDDDVVQKLRDRGIEYSLLTQQESDEILFLMLVGNVSLSMMNEILENRGQRPLELAKLKLPEWRRKNAINYDFRVDRKDHRCYYLMEWEATDDGEDIHRCYKEKTSLLRMNAKVTPYEAYVYPFVLF